MTGGGRVPGAAEGAGKTCLGCREWDPQGTVEWAARMGMAQCLKKQTRAHTLAHWRSCAAFAAAPGDEVRRRVVWLRDGGLYRRVLRGVVQSSGLGS